MVGDSMRKFVQLLNGRAYYIFEQEEEPVFNRSIEILEITDLDIEVKEGWIYNKELNNFSKPSGDEIITIDSIKPSIEEQILYETQYQTMLLEVGGGM